MPPHSAVTLQVSSEEKERDIAEKDDKTKGPIIRGEHRGIQQQYGSETIKHHINPSSAFPSRSHQ
ncbi:hypothetical protein MUP51_05985 [Candidatus Bathyarchaeota archaeon]|nr:hypothetical protein [Candidatus Bathyarchaeota archaeon]